jgi:hypothetical protein
MQAFTKALLDHVANPDVTPLEAVSMRHADFLAEKENITSENLAASTKYVETIEGPRSRIEEAYAEYQVQQKDDTKPVSRFEKPEQLIKDVLDFQASGLTGVFSATVFHS